jgi:hypothetical protein
MQYQTEITRYLTEQPGGGYSYAVRYDLVTANYCKRIARATILHVRDARRAETTVVDISKAYSLEPEAVDAFSEMLISVQRRANMLRDFGLAEATRRVQLKAQQAIENKLAYSLDSIT